MIDEKLWSSEELAIFEKHSYRCVKCQKEAVTLHELKPKSSDPKGWKRPENRVPICALCHRWAHDVGIKISTPILIQCQKDRLINDW